MSCPACPAVFILAKAPIIGAGSSVAYAASEYESYFALFCTKINLVPLARSAATDVWKELLSPRLTPVPMSAAVANCVMVSALGISTPWMPSAQVRTTTTSVGCAMRKETTSDRNASKRAPGIARWVW